MSKWGSQNQIIHDSINFGIDGKCIWTHPDIECLWTVYRKDKISVFNWLKDAKIKDNVIYVKNACQRDFIIREYLDYINLGRENKYYVKLVDNF